MKQLVFITGSEAKANEVRHYLHHPIAHQKIDSIEIQSLDLEEIVYNKAVKSFEKIKKPVLVEDVALQFNALGRLPGPLIKWFLSELGTKGLCNLLNNYYDRSAKAIICFGFFDGKTYKSFTGETNGIISDKPKGDESFGWNSIFIPDGGNKTWAEMTIEEKTKTSMRAKALKKLQKFLDSYKFSIE
jgi:non-canonical purine NTP pyrophosphatase (RdgB/HAM1 family)